MPKDEYQINNTTIKQLTKYGQTVFRGVANQT